MCTCLNKVVAKHGDLCIDDMTQATINSMWCIVLLCFYNKYGRNKFRSCCYKQCNAQFAHRVYYMNKEADEHRSPYFVALKNDLKAVT